MENSIPAKIVIECHTRPAFGSSCWSIRDTNDWRPDPAVSTTARQFDLVRISINHAARKRLFNTMPAAVRITPVSAWYARHAMPVWITIVPVTITIPIPIVMMIVTRMRIALVITQRIPADVITERDVENERDERRTPPAPVAIKQAARSPGPVTVVVNPAPVVIRRPSPRLVSNPRPAVRRAPRPLPVTIRRPIAVDVDRARKWTPDPTVIIGLDPVAIGVEILAAPDVLIVVLGVVLESLCEVTLAFRDPIINRIARCGRHQIPVTRGFTVDHEFRCAFVA